MWGHEEGVFGGADEPVVGAGGGWFGVGVCEGEDVEDSGACGVVVLGGLDHEGVVDDGLSHDESGYFDGADFVTGRSVEDHDVHALITDAAAFLGGHPGAEMKCQISLIGNERCACASLKIKERLLGSCRPVVAVICFHFRCDVAGPAH